MYGLFKAKLPTVIDKNKDSNWAQLTKVNMKNVGNQ